MASTQQKLPEDHYGVGHLSVGWLILVAIAVLILAVGMYAWGGQIIYGKVMTGARDIGQMGGAAWGIYIVTMLFALGVGFVGVAVVSLINVFKIHQLAPLGRIAEVLSLSALVVGLLAIMADLGQPFRALGSLLQYARPQSPFYGTMLLALSYLIGVAVLIYLGGRRDAAHLAQRPSRLHWLYRVWGSGYRDTPTQRARHNRVGFWMGIALLALLLLYHTTLGLVFGLIEARPVWSTPLLPVWHFVLNVISGMGGVLILVAALLRITLGARSTLSMEVFRPLAYILFVSIGVLLLVVYIEVMSTAYIGTPATAGVVWENFLGEYANLTWLSVVLMGTAFVLLGGQFVLGHRLSLIVVSAALVTVATFLQRYVVVVSSQTHGHFLPYEAVGYAPSWTEIGVVSGIIALGVLFFLVFMKVFPILDLPQEKAEQVESAPEYRWNPLRSMAVLVLVGGGLLVQAIAYFTLGASWGFPPDSVAHSNPVVAFAPLIYLLGVCISFSAAVVYELWPERGETTVEPKPKTEPVAAVRPKPGLIEEGA
jgi:protein NrfD